MLLVQALLHQSPPQDLLRQMLLVLVLVLDQNLPADPPQQVLRLHPLPLLQQRVGRVRKRRHLCQRVRHPQFLRVSLLQG